MTIEKIPRKLRWILSVITFWGLTLFLPFVLVLWNWISPYKMEPGTLSFLFFSICAQPFSCMMACYGAEKIAPDNNSTIVVVNATVSCTVFLYLLYDSWIHQDEWVTFVSHIASIALSIYTCVQIRRKADRNSIDI